MRCLICGNFTFKTLCNPCFEAIAIQPRVRILDNLKVYSFYDYQEIQFLLHAKYQIIGSKIYHLLAKKAYLFLKQTLQSPLKAYGIGIDDKISKQGYAHNAIFLKYFKKLGITPLYHTLLAQNSVSYAGKDLKFRQNNPRNFYLTQNIAHKNIILFDDLITTGLTLKEAQNLLANKGANVLMAFVLSDAKY
ncbi:ComF family protein [Helicobacter canadensis]|uniref:Uncharacterized protein n=1 Tax=Helicobacter canadensis MIT 98-5491 TaxID=537970 RepID=C5ZWJ3_9HELI|nr:ComF family protein [Helicobacter canadensis]EES89511.1 conserved hypothetical protein [Helicobacter canadensis MIT 98-5491]EFR48302.1 transformation system family protein [Helicobacter canadensis MIT 98-5491]STO99549.1 purine/pyrimidine phosphoribosyltransferase [Helicobacter canadensis]